MEHQRTSSYSCNFIGGGHGGGAKARSDALRRACVQRWLEIMTVPRVNHRGPQGVFFIMQLVDEGKGAESEKSSITSNREEYSDPEEKTASCVIRSTRVKPLSSDRNAFIVVCTLCVLLIVERLRELQAYCRSLENILISDDLGSQRYFLMIPNKQLNKSRWYFSLLRVQWFENRTSYLRIL